VTLTFDVLTLKVASDRVTCNLGYLCANFSLPRPLCSRPIGPMYATDRQTDRQTDRRHRRQTKASLNALPIRGVGIKMIFTYELRFVAFNAPCYTNDVAGRIYFSVRGIAIIGRNFVSGICEL